MNYKANVCIGIEIESAKAIPREGMTLDELIAKMHEIGNEILEINREENFLMLKPPTSK